MPRILKVAEQIYDLVCESQPESLQQQPTHDHFEVKNLNLNQIQSGVLHISVPLRAGEYEFPGKYETPAKVQVKEGTLAWLIVTLGQNPFQKTCITSASITISRSVIVNNPSTAYEENGSPFKDLFASVHIKGLDINSGGYIQFRGYTQKGFSRNDIREDFKPELFPRVNLELDSLIHSKSQNDIDENSIHDILVKLGGILGEAKVSLKLETQDSQGSLHLTTTLNKKGQMSVVADKEFESTFKHDNTQLKIIPELNISGVNMLRPKVGGTFGLELVSKPITKLSGIFHLERNKPTGFDGEAQMAFEQPKMAAQFQINTKSIRKGRIKYSFHPEAMAAFSRTMDYELFPKGKLALKPLNSGMAQFFSPETNFVTSPDTLMPANQGAFGDIGSDELRTFLQKISGTPIQPGNRLKLLVNGVNSMAERLKLIQSAQKSICLQTLIFKDDDSGMRLANALVEARKRGVVVKVIVDSLGNIEKIVDILRVNKAFELMHAGDVDLQFFSNLTYQGLQKIVPILEKHQALEKIHSVTELFEPDHILATFNLVARAALGSVNLGLSNDEKQELREGLRLLLGKNPNTDRQIEHLANISPEHPLKLVDLIGLMTSALDLNHRWHEKYFIVDGYQAIVGGMNIADEYLEGGSGKLAVSSGKVRPAWRDTDVLIEGPAAMGAYHHFSANLKTLTGHELPSSLTLTKPLNEANTDVQMVQTWPGQEPYHAITNAKVALINSLKAGDKAYEASAYFVPTGALTEFCEALKQAAKRGVDVRIVTNGAQSTDAPQVNMAALITSYRELLAAGVHIFERTGTQTMHQKVAVYGSSVSMIGSYNLDNRSASLNSECVSVIHNQEFSKQVEDMIQDDMKPEVAREVLLSDIQALPATEELINSAWAMLAELM